MHLPSPRKLRVSAVAVATAFLTGLTTLSAAPLSAIAHADATTAGQYVPLSPVGLLDTRTGGGAKVPAHGSVTFQVTGVGSIPGSGVSAVAVNINAHQPDQFGWLTIYPSDAPTPVSTITFAAGESTTGYDIARISSTGKLTVVNNSDGATHFTVNARGYYLDASTTSSGNEYHPVNTDYLYDTRFGIGTGSPTTPIPANATVTIDIAGQKGISDSGATAAAVNLVAMHQTADGWLSINPSDAAVSGASALNYTNGEVNSNFQIAKLSGTGKLNLTNHSGSTVDISLTVRGYYAGADGTGNVFTPTAPNLVLDTLAGIGTDAGSTAAVPAGGSIIFDGTSGAANPDQVGSVAVDINARRATNNGWLSVYPKGLPDPNISSVTFVAGESSNGFDTPAPGLYGDVVITNHSSGTVHLQVSIRGYYTSNDYVPLGSTAPLTAGLKISLDPAPDGSRVILSGAEQQQISDLESDSPIVAATDNDLTPEEEALMAADDVSAPSTPSPEEPSRSIPPEKSPYQLWCAYPNPHWSDTRGTLYMRYNCRYSNFNWGYKISSAVKAIITSNVNERGARWWKNGHKQPANSSHFVTKNYFFHGTFSPVYNYQLIESQDYMTFRVNIGGRPGTGSILWYGSAEARK